MSKRFTETDKWRDTWFRKLTAEHKLAYLYALDNCDAAGVWEADYELAEFVLGCKPDWAGLIAAMGERLSIIGGGKWHITRFIEYQYGELSEDCKPHLHVIRTLKSHSLPIPNTKGSRTLEDKDKDKDKDKAKETDKEKATDKTPAQIRAGAIFRKRPETQWDKSEQRALKVAAKLVEQTTEEEWGMLERFYAFKEVGNLKTYRRQDLATLLNNWSGELAKARAWSTNPAIIEERFNY